MAQGKRRADCPIGKNAGGRPRKHPMQKVLDKERLMQVAMDRGFETYKDFYDFLTEATGAANRARIVRKVSYGTWTYPDICLVSDALRLTPAEFLGVWFADLFHEIDGEIVASIPEDKKPDYMNRTLRTISAAGGVSITEAKRVTEEARAFLKSLD